MSESQKKFRRRSRWAEGLFSKNPVLVCGMALPFAIMSTTSLKSSVLISILFACSLLPTVLLASVCGWRVPRWAAPILYSLFSMAVTILMVPLVQPIARDAADSLGIYVPLLAVNTVLLTLCGRHSGRKSDPLRALLDAAVHCIGFAFALCMIASVRELLGNNTLWGTPVALPFKVGGVLIPFAAFIILALLSALGQMLHRALLLLNLRRHKPVAESSESARIGGNGL